MAPEEEPQNHPEPAETVQASEGPREGRRSNRGHRGRGRRHKRKPPLTGRGQQPVVPREELRREEPQPTEPVPVPETVGSTPDRMDRVETVAVEMPSTEALRPPAPTPETDLPEPPATLQEAIEHVDKVITALRESLDQMEEVLELLETLERQTSLDQREIDSLRRALRQLHWPRDAGREGGREGGHGYQR